MSDDPAVRAVAGSVTFQAELQSLENDTFGSEDTYGLNPGFRPFDEHVEAIARAAVEAARPIHEAQTIDKIASIAKPDTARWLTTVVCNLDFGPWVERCGCGHLIGDHDRDGLCGDCECSRRAAVRTEPEK